jgi:O-antigen ligase
MLAVRAGARSALLPDFVLAILAVVGAGAVGFILSVVGNRTGLGPIIVIAAPAALLGAIGVLRDPRVGILAVFVSMPWGFTHIEGLPLQLLEVVVAAVAVLVFLRRIGLGESPLAWSAPLGWYLALLLWVLIDLPSAVDHDLAVGQTGQLVGGLLFVTTVLGAINTARDVRRLMAVFVGVSAILAVTSLSTGEALQARFGGGLITGRASGIFTEPNQLGAMCSMAALVGIGLTLAARTRPVKLLGALATVGIIAGLLLSLSRGAWIGFILGILVLVVMLPRARRALVALALPLVALAAGLGAFAPGNPAVTVITERLGTTVTGNVSNPYDERPAIWREALREIRESPVTGEGPGGFPVAASLSGSQAQTVAPDHAHNILLTWAAEAGIPAALLLLGFAFHIAARTHYVSSRLRPGTLDHDRATLSGLAAAAASIVGQGSVDYVLRGPVVFYAAIAVVGALLAMLQVARPAPPPPPPAAERRQSPTPEAPSQPEPEPEPIIWRA